SHCKRIRRSRTHARYACRELLTSEQALHEREHSAIARRKIEARTEEEVQFVSTRARRQPGDFASAELTDHAQAWGKVRSERTGTTLAVDAAGSPSRIDSDILIIAGNLETLALLGVGSRGRGKQQTTCNQQLTHSSLRR